MMRKREREPSVAVLTSLLLGSLVSACSALLELRDCGGVGSEAKQWNRRWEQATAVADRLFEMLEEPERKQEALNSPSLLPLLDAIVLVAGECARLAKDALEQADYDARFVKIAERLKGETE